MSTFFMIPDEVESMAGGLAEIGQGVESFTKMLQALIAALHAASLVSFGATEAQAQVLQTIVPIAQKVAGWLEETSGDMKTAAGAYREVVAEGAQMLSD